MGRTDKDITQKSVHAFNHHTLSHNSICSVLIKDTNMVNNTTMKNVKTVTIFSSGTFSDVFSLKTDITAALKWSHDWSHEGMANQRYGLTVHLLCSSSFSTAMLVALWGCRHSDALS